MHVVHLMASPFFGGPERQVLGLARHLPDAYRSTFLSFAERGLAQAFLHEVRQAGFEGRPLLHNFPRLRPAIHEVADELRRLEADVLCCSGYKPDIIGWRAARRAGITVVSISHGWTEITWKVRVYEAVDRLVLRWMDAVVCVSAAQAQKVRRARVPEAKIVTIPNAIGEDAFVPPDPAYRDRLLGLFPAPPRLVIGAAGRHRPEKGLPVLVDAAARVLAQRPDVGFVLFGEGPLRADIEQRVQHHGLREKFVLAGFRTDLPKYLPILDLAVMSSFTEGLPVILLETFAAGVPMVATAVGGIPEVLEDGRGGFLIPAGDPAALAGRILDALRDDAARREMGRQAQARVRAEFSFTGQSARYQERFDRLIERRRAMSSGTRLFEEHPR